MKRFITLLLSAVMVITLTLPIFAIDENETECNFFLLNEGYTMPYGVDPEPTGNYTFAGAGWVENPIATFNENGLTLNYSAPEVALGENQSIIWYVCKYDSEDGWHIDGLIVEAETPEPEPAPAAEYDLRIEVPQKMAVRFEDGTVCYNDSTYHCALDKEYKFQMCSVNWDNGCYDDLNNGYCGTVVYRMKIVDKDEFVELRHTCANSTIKGDDVIDLDGKIIYINAAAENLHLETDVNDFFMAYRFSCSDGNFNTQTGIAKVIQPTEYPSINLPFGSTIDVDFYKNFGYYKTEKVFIDHNSGCGIYNSVYLTSVNDYFWN